MALIHLIYVSAAREEYSTQQLDEILDVSVRRNAIDGISGMLLYADGTFMQVLEGEDAVVDRTFSRIEKDRRHLGIVVIERAVVAARSFDGWHMGFRRLTHADAEAHPGFAPFFDQGFNARSLGVRHGLALEILLDFRNSARG